MKRRNPRKYRWFMDFGESIRRHSIVDEQLTRRLGWIMGGGVTIYIYAYGLWGDINIRYLAPKWAAPGSGA